MVNGVPREVPRPKREGPQALGVLAVGLSKEHHFPMIHPRLFHGFKKKFFWHNKLEFIRDFFQPMDSLGLGQQMLVELNLNILARDA